MKLYTQLLLVFALLFTACSQEKEPEISTVGQNLETQIFKIKAGSDTTITSKNGTKLIIGRNTFAADADEVEIKLKEALTLAEMAKAGLSTTSDGNILCTGGMIYIAAFENGEETKLRNPVRIQLPTSIYNPEMQLFKGELTAQNINWKPAGNMEKDAINTAYNSGQQYFDKNCGACHKMGEVLIGPDLSFITERRDKKWVNDFIRNSQAVINSGDKTAQCLFNSYNRVVMPPMEITDVQLQDLYTYIVLFSQNSLKERPKDNCNALNADATLKLLSARDSINERNNSRRRRMYDTARTEKPNYYYTFDIKDFGWYNCDRFLGAFASLNPQISVHFKDNKMDADEILIVFPRLKSIIQATVAQNKIQVSMLPANEKAIIVFASYKNNREAYFYKTLSISEAPVNIAVDGFNKSFKDVEAEIGNLK